jgi:hypothetical protein
MTWAILALLVLILLAHGAISYDLHVFERILRVLVQSSANAERTTAAIEEHLGAIRQDIEHLRKRLDPPR